MSTDKFPTSDKFTNNYEQLINSNLNNNPQFKTLSQSKKFLMLSLVLAADLSSSKKQVKDEEENFKKVLNELSELEEIIGVKSDWEKKTS